MDTPDLFAATCSFRHPDRDEVDQSVAEADRTGLGLAG